MAVDQADTLEAEVAEQPPDPRRLALPLVVVDQDLAPGRDPQRGEPGLPGGLVREPARPRGQRLGGLGVDPDRAGDVTLLVVGLRSGVEQPQVRIAEPLVQSIVRDQGGTRHVRVG